MRIEEQNRHLPPANGVGQAHMKLETRGQPAGNVKIETMDSGFYNVLMTPSFSSTQLVTLLEVSFHHT